MTLKLYDEIGIDSSVDDLAFPHRNSVLEKRTPSPDTEEVWENTDRERRTLEEELKQITTLDELKVLVLGFERCELKKNARNTVFCDGNPNAKVMLIGEAPGEQEDKLGIPFCGRSGHLLDKMLQAIELDRTKVYITNTIFWRPPGNRRPTLEETEMCRPFLEHHIRLVAPKLIVLLGSTASSALLKSQDRMSMMRGRSYEYRNPFLENTITTIVTFHPSYLLRQPAQKKLAWEDMKLIRTYIRQS